MLTLNKSNINNHFKNKVKNVINNFNINEDYIENEYEFIFPLKNNVFGCSSKIHLSKCKKEELYLLCPSLKNMILTGYLKNNVCITFNKEGKFFLSLKDSLL